VLTVELERGREHLIGKLEARVTGPDGNARTVLLRRVGDRRLEARIPLSGDGVYRAAVKVGETRFVRVPPVTLPYSPEFEPRRDPREGEKTLARIVRIAEGKIDPTADDLFAGTRTGRGVTDLSFPLAIAALVLLLLEIAVRRLDLRAPSVSDTLPKLAKLPRRKARKTPKPSTAPEPEPPDAPAPKPPAPQGIDSILSRAKSKSRRRRRD